MPTSEKSDFKGNSKIEHVFRKRISIDELHKYSFFGVYLNEDVINSENVALVPKGTQLMRLDQSVKEKLRKWKIKNISITIREQIGVKELEHIALSQAKSVKIDQKLARDTINQISDVYARIANGNCKREDVEKLVDHGNTLAKAAADAPEIMFCLGRVRESDEYTYVHSLNVALIGGFIANKLFPGNRELARCLSIGGVLHDLGKAKIPGKILNKPGPLSNHEFEIMKKHTIFGEELAIEFGVHDPRILSVIRGHHERSGGNGYPDVLSKDRISIEAKISTVADVFDALTARRVYKEPMESKSAVTMMIEKVNIHFDPDILRALIVSTGLHPPGATVELSDGSLGVVVGSSGKDLVRPSVALSFDKYGRKVEGAQVIDLSKSEESVFVKKIVYDFGKLAF